MAKGGYDAMMAGHATVQPGFMNKTQNMLSTVLPDGAVASNMEKQMVSSMKDDVRTTITHPASARERETINAENGGINGDFANHARHRHN